ncbi:FecR family protein [Dyadobacter pollutisoli]|uniref:FecR domain-containing protein n=1 Tax=Dyadobacter pollutisoli TaxID=2910158 RepID=A0A9E8SP36_9BACT|nr:FecR family protein [Dyadobacter pollutisoli]WAC14984.1 FecR domain-containing protein [Dyadobacter pollutisoli]
MKDDNFGCESLLNDDSFINWVLYGKDSFVWEEFVLLNPEHKDTIIRASQIIKELHEAEKITPSSADENKVWTRITTTLEAESQEVNASDPAEGRPAEGRYRKYKLVVSAAFLVLMLFGVWHFYISKNQITYRELVTHAGNVQELKEYINSGELPLKVKLPDGSVVTLSKNSKLSYPKQFEKQKRVVLMSGDAFFEVTKDPFRPFFVYANETITKVLGTSFRITAFDDEKKVTVNVRTGRVSVYKQSRIQTADPETMGLVLLPNQKVTFDRESESLVKNLIEIPVPIVTVPANEKKTFDEVPVSEIFTQLEKRYGIRIIYDQEQISKCIVSMALQNESLYDNLDVICKTIGGSYKEVDAQIVIESQGCQ